MKAGAEKAFAQQRRGKKCYGVSEPLQNFIWFLTAPSADKVRTTLRPTYSSTVGWLLVLLARACTAAGNVSPRYLLELVTHIEILFFGTPGIPYLEGREYFNIGARCDSPEWLGRCGRRTRDTSLGYHFGWKSTFIASTPLL